MSRFRNWILTTGLLVLCVGLANAQDQTRKHHANAGDAAAADQTTLDKLDVVHGRQDISIEITASAPVTPKVTTLTEPDRVVLDFPNTVPGTETRHISVDSDGVKSVRMGVNGEMPPTTRIVVDLEQARDYQLTPTANRIVLKFRNVPGAITATDSKVNPAIVPVANRTSEPPASKTASMPSDTNAPDTKTLASLNPTSLPAPPPNAAPRSSATSSSTAMGSSSPAPKASSPAPVQMAAAGSPSKPEAPASNVQKPATASATQNDPSPVASNAKTASSTATPVQPPATSTSSPVSGTEPATIASAQPGPADPAPANTPDVSKDDKSKAPPELKKADYDPKTYIIGEQDQLSIDVWREKEISTTAVVRPDGKITIPLVDEVYVVGLTPLQLQSLLEEKLKPFLTVPQVTVIVKEISSRRVYLMGQGGKNGPFLINSTTTVLQLIAQAGGLGPFAKRKKIDIMRQVGGETKHYRFNYDEVIKGKHLEQNIVLQPGDIIVVP